MNDLQLAIIERVARSTVCTWLYGMKSLCERYGESEVEQEIVYLEETKILVSGRSKSLGGRWWCLSSEWLTTLLMEALHARREAQEYSDALSIPGRAIINPDDSITVLIAE